MRHGTQLFLFTLLFLYPAIGGASQECETVNFVGKRDSPFNKIPVYHQGKINICYAYSAAQMADYHFIKNGSSTQRNVHPGWVAMHYALSRGRKQLDIGHTKEALEGLQKIGNCDYQTFSNALKAWASDPQLEDATILATLEENPMKNSVQTVFQITQNACQGVSKYSVSLPSIKMYNSKFLKNKKDYDFFLRRRLDKNESPISISYCSNIWKDPHYSGMTFDRKLKKDCKYHESLIVGKKVIGGSCHFLVRNTWGSLWTKNNSKLKCHCKNKITSESFDECDATNYSDNNFIVDSCWLPSDQLSNNVGHVTFFE
jgi:hypothetical protein